MQEITSLQNNLVKEVFKLQQKKYRENLILLEGKKSVESAIEAGLEIKHIFMLQNKINADYNGDNTYIVTEAIMKKLSTTDSPPDIIAVAKRPLYDINEFKNYQKIVLLDDIKDAGNLGTIIRASAAFGVRGIILFNRSTDAFSPKTIRSAAGNAFKLPIVTAEMKDLVELKKSHKFLATVVNSNNYPEDYNIPEKIVVMFGSEANGLCNELLSMADDKMTLKMTNDVESLNLAMSAVIILYILQQ